MKRTDRRTFLKAGALGGAALVLHRPLAFGQRPFAFGRSRARGDDAELFELICTTKREAVVELCAARLKGGTPQEALLDAVALAAARHFRDSSADGVSHAFLGLAPAWQTRARLPAERTALPLLQAVAWVNQEVQDGTPALPDVAAKSDGSIEKTRAALVDAIRHGDADGVDGRVQYLARELPFAELRELLFDLGHRDRSGYAHKLIMPLQAFALFDALSRRHLQELVRVPARYLASKPQDGTFDAAADALIAKHGLAAPPKVVRADVDAAAVREEIVRSNGAAAAEALAERLRDGLPLEAAGELVALAAAEVFLLQRKGGNLIGPVHANTSANATRHAIAAASRATAVGSLLVTTQRIASFAGNYKKNDAATPTLPTAEAARDAGDTEEALLAALRAAIAKRDEALAPALVLAWGELELDAASFFALLAEVATTDSGTTTHNFKHAQALIEDFAASRSPERWLLGAAAARFAANYFGSAREIHERSAKALGVPAFA